MNRKDLLSAAGAASLASLAAPALSATSETSRPLKSSRNRPLVVAAIVGNRSNIMDLAGPWEVFQDSLADGWSEGSFDLFTISDSRAPIVAGGSIRLVPNYAFGDASAPRPNIIYMGAQGEHTARKIAWIREASETADVVMSVCTGAFLLAKTGLIDGMTATTHHAYLDDFAKRFPQIRLNRTARYVENPGGKFCSAGGIASGIELALRVVERYFGENTPARAAYYMEYTRSPNRPTT